MKELIRRARGSRQSRPRYFVVCRWDDEAGVWYVHKSNIPGLAADADTIGAMQDKIVRMAHDLLSDEGPEMPSDGSFPVKLDYQREVCVPA